MGSWHEEKLRVRYEETDMMGVVHHGRFLVWMEAGRVALMRDVGFGFREWERHELECPIVQAHADFKAPARFEDEVLVKTRVAHIGKSSIRFENEIYRLPEKTLLATGHTIHVLTNGKGEKVPFSPGLKAKLTSA